MIRVSPSIYSGREDPSWILTEQEEKEFIERILAKPELVISLSQDSRDPLTGFSGFYIEMLNFNIEFKSRGIPNNFKISGYIDKDETTSQWLLDTADNAADPLSDEIAGSVKEAINRSCVRLALSDPCTPAQPTNPDWCQSFAYNRDSNLSFWNNDSNVAKWNCYNFAANHKTYDRSGLAVRAQPGCFFSKTLNPPFMDYPNNTWVSDNTSCDPNNYFTPDAACIRDGWVNNGCFNSAKRSRSNPSLYDNVRTIVAALLIGRGIDPQSNSDYHWLRLCSRIDSDGIERYYWFQKHGKNAATIYDDNISTQCPNGQMIVDPRTAFILNYPTFCGFFGFPFHFTSLFAPYDRLRYITADTDGMTTVSYIGTN